MGKPMFVLGMALSVVAVLALAFAGLNYAQQSDEYIRNYDKIVAERCTAGEQLATTFTPDNSGRLTIVNYFCRDGQGNERKLRVDELPTTTPGLGEFLLLMVVGGLLATAGGILAVFGLIRIRRAQLRGQREGK